nr:CRISPR-associated endonuclease Cas3'' [Thiocystis minor]
MEKVAALVQAHAAQMFPFSGNPLRDLAIELARRLGLWHDLGKFSEEFQRYLLRTADVGDDAHTLESRGKVDHSTAGAQHAARTLPGLGILLAYAIAGHHAGLPDALDLTHSCLKARLRKSIPDWLPAVPPRLLDSAPMLASGLPADKFAVAFFTRLLFSCLTDADFLATEAFMSPERATARPIHATDIMARLDDHLSAWLGARFTAPVNVVQQARAEVLAACLSAAEQPPGLYSLTVPTGGGKTLSSLAFALRHAARHGLRRVIHAIPFTSIIEQNADVFREVFAELGAEIVLEHHSNFDPDQETATSRLATENWDAPLIVTTNVQLFESLFANRTSRCRKLHRIARSVIVLDEAQTLPVTLLAPCLRALRELVEHYGCTVVLCTATQPALVFRPGEFEIGLPNPTEIVPDPPTLYATLKRVEVRQAGRLGVAALRARLAEEPQVLAIVNTRRHAADLYGALVEATGSAGNYHLSAAMCPQHRSAILAEIRERLADGERCRVVSTQLIEAGVDVDFPVVYRAMGGVDAIAQAAGRCNREGQQDQGVTWVFEPDESEHPIPRGYLRRAADAAREILPLHADPLALDTVEAYFRLHYWKNQDLWDQHAILDGFNFAPSDRELPFRFNFATVAERFRFIADTQRPVIVPWGETGRKLVDQLRATHRMKLPPPAGIARRLQRYSVTIPQFAWQNAQAQGLLELLHERFAVLVSPELHYASDTGLCMLGDGVYDPEQLIID